MNDKAAQGKRRNSRALRWTVALSVGAVVVLCLALLLLLTRATDNRAMYERTYGYLFVLNMGVALLLLAVVIWIAWRLWTRLRQGKFGSRLLVKLATIFGLVGVLPGVLIYGVSYQFVASSIESWFDVRVENALDAGVALGRATLDNLSTDLITKAQHAAAQLAQTPDTKVAVTLEHLREQLLVTDAVLWTSTGQVLASVGSSRFLLQPERPSTHQLRSVRMQQVITQIDGLDEATQGELVGVTSGAKARIKVLIAVSNPGVNLSGEVRLLQLTDEISSTLAAHAMAVQQAHRQYQERALARDGLKKMYIGTLTLSLFLAVFGAVLLAVLLGNQLARPLLLLAEGVKQVAQGDLGPKVALQGKDELGGLTRAFASMTEQLADARAAVQTSMSQVDAARTNLQTILDNLTAGVLVLGKDGCIHSSNPGATRILRVPLAAYQGRLLSQVPGLEVLAQGVQQQFEAQSKDSELRNLDHWQQSFELDTASAGLPPSTVTVIARGAVMPGQDRLLVLDDVSEMVSAQRVQAWGEVARRLAHEIKNPLTPIRLSAERLEHKLSGKIPEPEQALLTKATKTIVDQVDALKHLVNEFRDYARLPPAQLQPLDLNALVGDVMHLYPSDNAVVPVHVELDATCPRVGGDEQQLRQVIHNLLQNAQDAALHTPQGYVLLKTEHVPQARRVRLSVSDNGPGFSEHILKRACEPYVTTKVKGTGLGLAVVKKIADEHGARMDVANLVQDELVQGAKVSLSFAVAN